MIGAARTKTQYQQQGGMRENITVMVTICADGTLILPTIVFKGKAFQLNWLQDNPLNASSVLIVLAGLHAYFLHLTGIAALKKAGYIWKIPPSY